MQYEDMTLSQGQSAFEEFMAERPRALERLRGLLIDQGLEPDQTLDGSVESLRVVQLALCPRLRLRPGPRTAPEAGPTWARFDLPPRVDVESTWVIDSVVSYYSEVLIAAVTGTRWQLGGRDTREDLYRCRPLLVHDSNYLFPPRSVCGDMEQFAFPSEKYDPDLRLSAKAHIGTLSRAPVATRVTGDEIRVADSPVGEHNLTVGFDPDLVFEVRFILTAIMRRLRKQPDVLNARWKGNRILVRAPTWTAEQMKAWWVAELEREFAGPI